MAAMVLHGLWPGAVNEIPLSEDAVFLGRNEVTGIKDIRCSRKQAKIELKDGKIYLTRIAKKTPMTLRKKDDTLKPFTQDTVVLKAGDCFAVFYHFYWFQVTEKRDIGMDVDDPDLEVVLSENGERKAVSNKRKNESDPEEAPKGKKPKVEEPVDEFLQFFLANPSMAKENGYKGSDRPEDIKKWYFTRNAKTDNDDIEF